MLRLITVFVIVTSLINLFRLSWYLVGAEQIPAQPEQVD